MTAPAEKIGEFPHAQALTAEQIELLDADLDERRVKTKPGGGGRKYLAEHDVIRTANRIFGYGNWGTQVITNECIAACQVTNSNNEQGWYVGYRCTVRLTVKGCLPVDGCGYGDAFEKQWSAEVTAHELAYKEAESDAIKRAFKKWGDQFGLILYAKAEDLVRIQQEKEHEAMESLATEGEIAEMLSLADQKGKRSDTDAYMKSKERIDGAFRHRHFLAMMNRLQRLPDAGAGDTEEGVSLEAAQKPIVAAWADAGDRPASDAELEAVIEICDQLDEETSKKTRDAMKQHMEKFHGLTSSKWLAKLTDALLEKTKGEFVPPAPTQQTLDGTPTTEEVEQAYA